MGADNAALCRSAGQVVALDDAKKISGLRAVFGEVYPDPVRVIAVGQPVDSLLASPDKDDWLDYSIEFCGGGWAAVALTACIRALGSRRGIVYERYLLAGSSGYRGLHWYTSYLS